MKEYDELLNSLTTTTIKVLKENKQLKKRISELEFDVKKYRHLHQQNREKRRDKYGYVGTTVVLPSACGGVSEWEEE